MMANPYAPPRSMVLDFADSLGGVEPADRGTRLGASILDGVIFMAMVYLPLILVRQGFTTVGALVTLASFAVWCRLTIRYVRDNGQSIGKNLLGIKVVRSDGSPVSLGRVFWLRNVVNSLISLVPLYSLVDALFILAESRQCLHDKLADTIVVKV